jgi:hypothetical protein
VGRGHRPEALTNPARERGYLVGPLRISVMPRFRDLLLVAALLVPASLPAQNALPPAPEVQRSPSRFRFGPEASTTLRDLWTRSVAEKREYVACMGGVIREDSVFVERVLPLEPTRADSLGVSAQASIDTCGPPLYHGTVHTHIALIDGERPYERFSGSDRGVMLMWWRRWKMDGMFCVLYTQKDAYCEVDGSGIFNMSRSAY